MDLMELLLNTGGGGAISQIAQQFGLQEDQAQSAVASLLPALQAGLSRNVKQEGGMDSLFQALAGGGHQQYLDNPGILGSAENIMDGNGILGHILGSKDVSRAVAAQASQQTGIGTDILKKMLPIVASLLMGSLSRQTNAPAAPQSPFGQAGGGMDILASILGGGDDSSAGGLMGMLGKLFGG
ncbi:MAG TPA: DUF937 domain-containing protein [Acidobacteriota bacterium]|nr:DUF937 domain-containing protein [Acidobacteriota bacterium]